jgi:tetratricopeptide (TPR) repeat protein
MGVGPEGGLRSARPPKRTSAIRKTGAPPTVRCTACGAENQLGKRFCGDCGTALADQPSAAPRTIANGRFELQRLLGEGGKKRVYLARDMHLEREVALSLIKAEGLDATGRTRVLREAQAMGRLGANPNIVAVFDLGEEGGQPYLVSELMEGGDLEGLLDRSPKRQLPIPQVLDLATGIARGLAFAHAKGLVHRDLKPGNIWLTADGTPKIGDFGLALALERSRLTQEGMIVGTVAYLPPEQALGGEVTPRADLYSLGALLYEFLTGRPPFLGDDPVGIISQHINTPPVAPSWHRADCPKALEALVLRLLAKDPTSRPESAADVLAALAAIQPTAAQVEPSAAPDEHSLDALAAGVFVGRRKELETLRAALEETLSGHGRLVTLVGEPGIGKTRTATELTTYARLRRAQVLWGRCYESAGAPPYWPFVQALRGYVREREPEQLRRELGSTAAALAEILPELSAKLPGLAALPAAEPAQARFRLFDSVTSFLRAASQDQPILLVLDDLHWADGGTLSLLEFLARELEGSRLLVLGTYRDVELTKGHPLAATLAELTRERLFERVLLRGLAAEDVGRFIAGTAGITPPEALVAAVYRHTEGNPLFVTEVVRLLVQEGAFSPERLAAKEHWSVRIPDGVREVIGRRLERLSERCQDVLRTAAVLGREFTMEQLGALSSDLGEERLLAALEEALAARIVEELPRSVGRFGFTHALIQDTLVSGLSATRKARLHGQIGETLERLYGDRADQHAGELAYHFGEARSTVGTGKFVHYALLAGEQALARYAYQEAADRFSAVVAARDGSPTDAETAAALLGLGRAQAEIVPVQNPGSLAVRNVSLAFDWYVATGDHDRAVRAATSLTAHSFAIPSEAREMVTRALSIVPADSLLAGRLLALAGWYRGLDEADYDGGAKAFERALAIARLHADLHLEARVLANWAHVDSWHMRWEACLEHSLAAIELAMHAGDEYGEMRAHVWAIRALTPIGELHEARVHGAAALALAERLRGSLGLAGAASEFAYVFMLTAEWERARELLDRGLAADPHSAYEDLTVILESQVGNLDAVSRHLEQIEESGRVAPMMPQHLAALAYSGALAGWFGGSSERLAAASKVATVLLGSPRSIPSMVFDGETALALSAIHRRDSAAAERAYEALAGYTGGTGPFIPVAADHVLGLLAHTMGRDEAATGHFEVALTFCARAGYRPAYGWAAADYSALLLDRGEPADHARAIALGNEALEIGRELGMRPLVERVLARREFLKA